MTRPGSVAVSPDGQDVYVAGTNGDGTDYVTVLDVVPGGLAQHPPTEGGCVQEPIRTADCRLGRAMLNVSQVVVSPDGAHVYATSTQSNAVTGFTRAADGGLTPIAGTDGCLQMAESVAPEGCTETGLLGTEISPIAFATDQRAYVGGVSGSHVTLLERDVTTGALTAPGSCVSNQTLGPLAGCTDSSDLFGVVDLAVAPSGRALVAAARFGRGLHLFPLDADGSLQAYTAPEGCLATGGSFGGVPESSCTHPRGFAFSPGADFGPNGVALAGPWVYAVSPADAEDGPGIVVARRAAFGPECQDATVDVTAGQQVSLPLSCTDGDDDPIARSIVTAPAQGGLGPLDGSGKSVTYSAPADAGGTTQTATFRGTANGTDSNVATVTIRVAAPGIAPPPAPPPPASAPPRRRPPRRRRRPRRPATRTRTGSRTPRTPPTPRSARRSPRPSSREVVSGEVLILRPAGSTTRSARARGARPAGSSR